MAHPKPSDIIRIGQLEIRYLLEGAHSHTGMGTFELTVPPNAMVPPPHSHAKTDEYIHVLAGTLRYSVDDVTRDLRPGEWMFTPRGAVHGFSNPYGETARALTVLTPDIGIDYFREMGDIFNAGGPLDVTQIEAVMLNYGLMAAALGKDSQ